MGRVAVMMAADRAEGPMSAHFGKADWVMVADIEKGTSEFVRNEGLNGRSAADLLAGKNCTDVILVDIGDGALRHLQASKIRAWAAPGPVTGQEALRMLAEGHLPSVPVASASTSYGDGHGCCCARRDASAAATRCCG